MAQIVLCRVLEPQGESAVLAPVTLRARLGGRELTWPARIVRTEGEIDPRTRMLHVVARVDDPYGRESGAPSLPAGLFVRAEIEGRELRDAFVLPVSALRDDDTVYLVDAQERLVRQSVEVLKRTRDSVVLIGGLDGGERVILSPLRVATDGMQVRPLPPEPASTPPPPRSLQEIPGEGAAS